jgi:hypothetical protein
MTTLNLYIVVRVNGLWTRCAPVLGDGNHFTTVEDAKAAGRELAEICDGSWTAYEIRDALGNRYGGRNMPVVLPERFRQACRDQDGWCVSCEAFTRSGGVEPDAERYNCPRCEENTVMGAEQALAKDKILFAAGAIVLCPCCNGPYSVIDGCDCQAGE